MEPEKESSLKGGVALEEETLEELEGQDLARIIPTHGELGLAKTTRILRGTGIVNKIASSTPKTYYKLFFYGQAKNI